jgi:hypothetical protein
VSAIRHWLALDEAVCRIIPRPLALRARARLAHRAAALSDIYVARILKTIAAPAADEATLARHIRELRLTHHELTEALTREWTVADGRLPPTELDRKVGAD